MTAEPLINDTSSTTPTLSRRTIAKGAAWALPVMAFAGAAPAFATSPVVSGSIQSACKYPGSSTSTELCTKSYRGNGTLTNSSNQTLSVTLRATLDLDIDTIHMVVVDNNTVYSSGTGQQNVTISLPPGTHQVSVIGSNSNSGNRTGTYVLNVKYTYNGSDYSYDISYVITSTPPNCTDICPPV